MRGKLYTCFMALNVIYSHTHTHTRVCAKFLNSSFILVRAFTLMDVKILTLCNSNIYFIYFNTFLYSTPNISSIRFFFLTSFKYFFYIIFTLFLSSLSSSLALLLLCFFLFSEVWTKINQATCHQQLHNTEKTYRCQIPITRSHNKEKAYTMLGKKKGSRWSVVTPGERDPRIETQAKKF